MTSEEFLRRNIPRVDFIQVSQCLPLHFEGIGLQAKMEV